MNARVCLLVSDDPDDHIEFAEALYEISNDIILVTVTHPEKALEFLALRQVVPAYIFLNLEMNGFAADDFLEALERSPDMKYTDIIAYGEYGDYDKLKTHRITAFLNSEMGYADLRNFFEGLVTP